MIHLKAVEFPRRYFPLLWGLDGDADYSLREPESFSRRLHALVGHAERQHLPRHRILRQATSLSRLYQFNACRMILASSKRHPAAIATRPQDKVKEFEGRSLIGAAPWSLFLGRYGRYSERAKSWRSRESM
jgi:hypothetical protein